MKKIKFVKYAKTNTWHTLYFEGEMNHGANCNGRWKAHHYNDSAESINEIPKGSKLCKKCFTFKDTYYKENNIDITEYNLV